MVCGRTRNVSSGGLNPRQRVNATREIKKKKHKNFKWFRVGVSEISTAERAWGSAASHPFASWALTRAHRWSTLPLDLIRAIELSDYGPCQQQAAQRVTWAHWPLLHTNCRSNHARLCLDTAGVCLAATYLQLNRRCCVQFFLSCVCCLCGSASGAF